MWDLSTDIHQRSQTSYTPCVIMLSAMGLNFGGLQVFADYTRKINAFMIFARRALFCASLSSRSDRGTYTHLTNHYFHNGKNQKILIFSPCRDQDGPGSGISGLYLWICQTFFSQCNLNRYISWHIRTRTKEKPCHGPSNMWDLLSEKLFMMQ